MAARVFMTNGGRAVSVVPRGQRGLGSQSQVVPLAATQIVPGIPASSLFGDVLGAIAGGIPIFGGIIQSGISSFDDRGRDDCGPFQVFDPVKNRCVLGLGERPGPDRMPSSNGTGAALHAGDHAPFIVDRRTRLCLKGHVLGTDGVCHKKSDIRNSDREYPKPTRPIGTSGDINAVTKASAFGRRLKTQKKKLKKLQSNLNIWG